MAAFVGKLVMKKIFKEKKGSEPQENVYYNKVPAKTMGISHTKKEKKPLPPGLTTQEMKVLRKAKARAFALDMAFIDKGFIKLGWSSVIGLIPGIGDVLDLLLAMFVYRTCCSVEPPLESDIKRKMQMNLLIDFVIGLVPVLGDVADMAYRCNTKNVILLEDTLVKRAKRRQGTLGGDQQLGDRRADDRYEETALDRLPPRNTSTQNSRRPEPAHQYVESESAMGQFGGRSDVDIEAGQGLQPIQPARIKGSGSHKQRGRDDRR